MFMLIFSELCIAIGWLRERFLRIIKKLKFAIIDGTAWISATLSDPRERDHGADLLVQIIEWNRHRIGTIAMSLMTG